jgi:HSP20 family molecular chaperone IbpA
MAERVKVRKPVRGFWRDGAEVVQNAAAWLRRRTARLMPKPEQDELEWEEWCSWQGGGFDYPPARLAETEEDILLTVQTPGYQAADIEVTVLPRRLTVDAQSETFRQKRDGPEFFAELGERRLMRQFDLPVAIAPETAYATWEDGALLIAARKKGVNRIARKGAATAA